MNSKIRLFAIAAVLIVALIGCGDDAGGGKIEPIANPPANKAPAGSPHPIPGGPPSSSTTGK